MQKKHYTNNKFFYKIEKKPEREIFAFFVITFEPIKIQTRSAPQNDRLNFSFVKDSYVCSWQKNGKKGSEDGHLSVANFGHHPLCQGQVGYGVSNLNSGIDFVLKIFMYFVN